MDLKSYKLQKSRLAALSDPYRAFCYACRQSAVTCFCSAIAPFDPKMKFVILIHPIEARRRIATGRMSHLCLKDSHLIIGEDFSKNDEVERVLAQGDREALILYPGRTSINLSELTPEIRDLRFSPQRNGRPLTVFVIDGTWAHARRMVRLSTNLHALTRISFVRAEASRFRVRKQPKEGCFSTIEAIHQTLELLGPSQGFDPALGEHQTLLRAFDLMVERQIAYRDDPPPKRESGKNHLPRA